MSEKMVVDGLDSGSLLGGEGGLRLERKENCNRKDKIWEWFQYIIHQPQTKNIWQFFQKSRIGNITDLNTEFLGSLAQKAQFTATFCTLHYWPTCCIWHKKYIQKRNLTDLTPRSRGQNYSILHSKRQKLKTQTGSKADFPNREHYQSSQELLELLDGKTTEKPQH